MTYSGWKNWETWNTVLWCDNEEGIYRARMEQKPKTADQVEDFVREFFPNGTPDMTGDNYDPYSAREAVDWEEIADHWKDDYGEEEKDEDAA